MRTQSTDTSPEAERVLIGLIRKASVAKRFKSVQSLTTFAATLNLQNIKQQHPDASKEEVGTLFVADHHSHTLADRLHLATQHKTTEMSLDLLNAIVPMVEFFTGSEIAYYMQGTVANSLYGLQRAAFDVHFVADLCIEHIDALLKQLASVYAIDEQMIREAIGTRTAFDMIHIASLVKVRVSLMQNNDYQQAILQRLQKHVLLEDGFTVDVASPEDVILTQLMEYRANREVADDQWNEILGVLKVQADNLDFAYLNHWASELSLSDLLKRGYADAGLLA
ncbi:MAG: hypothetical protein M3Y39_19795 [Chloroflexota bacterium]|nr:hypothetical protein [Chloroflexota bacterium]